MGEKECSQDQVFNENSVPKAAKWGNLNTKSVTIFRVFAQRWKKIVTILSNTFMVTVTQDDSKCKWQQHAHLAKARGLFYSKIRSVIKRMILFNTSNCTDRFVLPNLL